MGQGLVTGYLTRYGVGRRLSNRRLCLSIAEGGIPCNRRCSWIVGLTISEDISVVFRELGGLRHEGIVSRPLELTNPFLEIVKPATFRTLG